MWLTPFLPAAAGGGDGVGTTNADTKNPFNFNNVITLNSPLDDPDDTYEIVTVAAADQFSLQTEPLPQEDGQQSYIPRKVRKMIHIDGIIHAPTLAKLTYKAMQLNYWFDPINAFWADTASTMDDNKGFLPLYFTVPTTDTAKYATGEIDVVAYVRSVQRPVQVSSKLQGYSTRFQIVLEMIDPRFYYTTEDEIVLTNFPTTKAWVSLTEYPTYPVLTLVWASGAISTIQINRVSPNDENGNDYNVRINPSSTLDGAAAVPGDTITFDMATGRPYLNGVLREDFLVPGYMDFWPVTPGAIGVDLHVGTMVFSTQTLTYYRAFP